jgi:hypothetical protein
MAVSNQCHSLATLLLEKEPPIPIRYEAGRAPTAYLDTVEKIKMHCPCWEWNSRFLSYLAHNQPLY